MKPPMRAMLAAVFIASFMAVGSASLTDSARLSLGSEASALWASMPALPLPARRAPAAIPYTATAYCQRGTTRSGVDTRAGIAAADPSVLPVGSVVHIESPLKKYTGVYTVLDTGSKVLGRQVDLFMRDCHEAQQFGRRSIRVEVIRKGWNPRVAP